MANYEPPSPAAATPPTDASSPAGRADEGKSLAKIVHELRNPLSTFSSALHLLDTQPDQPDLVRQLVGMMLPQLERLTRTVEELAAHVAAEKSQAATQSPTAAGSGEPLPALKILLVDDNQSATHMMGRLLQKLGQNVQVASSGGAALDQMTEFAPDFVISDIAMPGMSGYDLARRIRELQLPKRPYLVAVTGYGQEADRQEALAAGFDRHLTKPIGVGALEDLLRTCGS
jgi:CheY-like chemotaxis protein